MSFSEIHFEMAEAEEAEEAAEHHPHKKSKLRPTTHLTFKPVIVKKGKSQFFGRKHRLPQFSRSKIEDAATQSAKASKYQIAAVHPPSFFKPPVGAQYVPYSEQSRFAVAADELELSAPPTDADLPALNIEATSDAATLRLAESEDAIDSEVDASVSDAETSTEAKAAISTFFSEIKSLLSSKVKRA